MNVIHFDVIDSTNTYLKNHFWELPHLTVVTAKHQISGRGRMGKSFIDDSTQLLFSILLKENIEHIQLFPLFAAKVIHELLLNYSIDAEIKWPNDILVNEKKLCGILTESVYLKRCEALIIGIGINVNTTVFPEEIKDIAISLKQLCSHDFSLENIFNEFIVTFEDKLSSFYSNPLSVVNYINQYSSLKDKYITYYTDGILQEGKVIEIAENGALHIISNQNHLYLNSGEIIKIQSKKSID